MQHGVCVLNTSNQIKILNIVCRCNMQRVQQFARKFCSSSQNGVQRGRLCFLFERFHLRMVFMGVACFAL